MWKADFGAVDSTVACGLEEGEEGGIVGVEEDGGEGFLGVVKSWVLWWWREIGRKYLDVVHGC